MKDRAQFIREYKLINGDFDAAADRAYDLHESQGGSSNLKLKRLIVDLQRRVAELERRAT